MRAAALVIGLCVTWSDAAHAGPASGSSFWLHGGIGATFASATTLSFSSNDADVRSSGMVHASFDVGVHYRAARFDIGLMAGGMGSGGLRGLERNRQAGAKARICASVRWRYIDEPWGGLFLRFAPGLALLDHSEAMRSEVAIASGLQPDQIADIDAFNAAFTVGSSLGVILNIERWISVYLEFEVVATLTDMQDGTELVGYTAIQPIVALGFEARL